MSFKCRFDVDGGVERNAWLLLPPIGQETYIECEPFTVSLSLFFLHIKMHIKIVDDRSI